MIQRVSHMTVFCLDQDKAKDFYVNVLGFEPRKDISMGEGFRWVTVGPKDQPDFEIALMEPRAGFMFDEGTAQALRELVQKGALGAGVFDTLNCQTTYEELKARGVEFMAPPEEKFYGTEAIFKDNSGNWFSLSQHKPH